MSKILTTSQKTFVDIYDSYNLSVTPDIISVLCNDDGSAKYGTSVPLHYTVKAGGQPINAKCSYLNEDLKSGILVNTDIDGEVILTVEQGAQIGINASTIVKLTITTQNNDQVVFDYYVTIIGVKSSDALCSFKIYSKTGNVFTENIETITLDTVLLDKQTPVDGDKYNWSYHDNSTNSWTDIDESSSSLNVTRSSQYNNSTIKCVVTYNDTEYSDYFIIQPQVATYTAVARLLDKSSIFGDSRFDNSSYRPDVVLVYIDLYKNNELEETIATKDWYMGDSRLENDDGYVYTDIDDYIVANYVFNENDELYFVCPNNNAYDVVLGVYTYNDLKDWRVKEIENEYVYVNDMYGQTISNILAIPLRGGVPINKEINVCIYNKIYDENNEVSYDSDSPLCRINFSLETAVLTQNANQYFSFDPANGLKIGQQDEQFYTQISSTKMGFYDNTDGSGKEVVSIGNKSATIKNMVVQENAEFDCNAQFNQQVDFFGFVWKKEFDGSLSLAIR